MGSGRNYVVVSGELNFPLVTPMEGALFVDYGSDLGSGSSVLGNPAGACPCPVANMRESERAPLRGAPCPCSRPESWLEGSGDGPGHACRVLWVSCKCNV